MAYLQLSVARPAWLWLSLLAVVPWLYTGQIRSLWPWLGSVPRDGVSSILNSGLRSIASLGAVAFSLAGAGLEHGGERIELISRGAHIVLLIDRSSSMNETFAGRAPGGTEESKAAAAKHLLKEFVGRRGHDRIGLVAFSTAPLFVLPLSDHIDAVRAAIDPIDLPGLAYTDVARGLAMAVSMFEQDDPLTSRVIVLVSDGAAVIDRHVQERLRSEFAAHPVSLYWLFLRTQNGPGIFDPPGEREDTPQEMPERHLNLFFQSLGIPYRPFEAADAAALASAIDEIDRTETAPIRYTEVTPKHELAASFFLLAAVAMAFLITAKLAEVRVGSVR